MSAPQTPFNPNATTAPGDVHLSCRCGAVRGLVTGASPQTVNRVVCYCDDCQAYAHFLGRADLLDPCGGSDIVQIAPARLSFVQGQNNIQGLRLTPKGLHRWYARCCNTPLGNMVSPAVPFVGIVSAAFDLSGQSSDQIFGKPKAAIKGEYAIGGPPPGSKGIGLALMAGTIAKVLGWRLKGLAWPHPFFDKATGAALYPVASLTAEERGALRPFCGPKPAAGPPLAQ